LQSAQIFPLIFKGAKKQKKMVIRKLSDKYIDFVYCAIVVIPLTLIVEKVLFKRKVREKEQHVQCYNHVIQLLTVFAADNRLSCEAKN
jgi:hypothetical protein